MCDEGLAGEVAPVEGAQGGHRSPCPACGLFPPENTISTQATSPGSRQGSRVTTP